MSVKQVNSIFTVEDIKVDYRQADSTLQFLETTGSKYENVDFSPEEVQLINRKLNWILLPLIITINTLLFIDKSTLSYALILGIYESTGIDTAQYDDLNSIFYTGYVVGQVLNFALQKFNLAHVVTVIVFVWSILVFAHCGANSFAGLVVLRFLLGFTESVVVSALEITLLQFYTPKQRATLQPIFWTGCVGFPVVIAGFIAYGVLHIENSIAPWKIFMIINGGLTFVLAIVIGAVYPGDPSESRFLTDKEKFYVIKKVQTTSKAAIVQHQIKSYQVRETLQDPITWLFAGFCFLLMLANNLNYQQNLLFVSLGVSNLGSTLVAVAGGGFASLYALFGALLIHYFPNKSFWMTVIGCLPSIASGIAMVTVLWDNKLVLLAMLSLGANTYFLAYIVGYGWSTASCSGNTKRYIRHLIYNVAYGISNIVSPQIWKGGQAPRYYVAWSIQIVLAWFGAPVIAGIITLILRSRNKLRLQKLETLSQTSIKGTIVKYNDSTGQEMDERVDIANLDLTDLENETFIYPL